MAVWAGAGYLNLQMDFVSVDRELCAIPCSSEILNQASLRAVFRCSSIKVNCEIVDSDISVLDHSRGSEVR
uniref:Uncharacterized protein n=1 Tax=Physcomitrium patens TaxID=3218 RepID=A0A2K1L2T4_PHYPA|nr:hypothetical protein PHYPA_003133 [Physcomitrium patens]